MSRKKRQTYTPIVVVSLIIVVLLLGGLLYSAGVTKENVVGEAAKKKSKPPVSIKKDIKTELLTKLKTQLQLRQGKMAALIENDPAAVLRIAYPSALRNKLDSTLKPYIEQEVTIEGTLRVEHSDDFEQGISKFYYYLDTADGKYYQLQFVEGRLALRSGSLVQVQGIKVGNSIALRSVGGNNFQVLQSAGTPFTGATVHNSGLTQNEIGAGTFTENSNTFQNEIDYDALEDDLQEDIVSSGGQLPFTVKKVAVVLFNFQNEQSQPFTKEFIRERIFTASEGVKAYYQEVSFGQLIVSGKINQDGDVYGWFTIPYDNSYCEPNAGLSTSLWRLAVLDAALTAGVDLSGYDNIIYIFPHTDACDWMGYASIGGSISMINAAPANFPTGTVAHELGHNFGAHHASSLYNCYNLQGQHVPLGPYCGSKEYGDVFDVMGKSASFHHLNTYHKQELGWYNPVEWMDITTLGEFEVTLTPLGQSNTALGNDLKLVRVERGSNLPGNPLPETMNSIYLEYRQPTAVFDAFSSADPVVNGVSLRLGSLPGDFRPTFLLDTTPTTDTLEDAALAAGQTFVDEISGISITAESVSPAGAEVRVVKAQPTVCYHGVPSIFLEPESPVANGAGQTLTSTAKIRNNDNAACAPQTMSAVLNPTSLPAGWSASPSPTETALGPGQEATVNLVITSAATASVGVYTLPVIIKSAGNDNVNPYLYTPVDVYYWIYECTVGVCTSPCGNGVVNTGENCNTCPLDASCE